MSKSLHKAILLLSITYLLVVSAYLVFHRTWFSPDQFFAVALIATLILGKFKQFIRDWSIPIILLLSYDYLRGLVPLLQLKAHIYPMIKFDLAVFGLIPTIGLQNQFYSAGSLNWYDYLGVLLYMSHFITPMVIGFTFWLYDRRNFHRYFTALLILSYAGFLTYIIFPAVPPWMASQMGIIPNVQKIMDKVFASSVQSLDVPTLYRFISANKVAAVPSLHAAYPFLIFLFVMKKLKKFSLLLLPYIFGVWFSVVYFGEHYVFDIVIGVIYAILAFYFVVGFRGMVPAKAAWGYLGKYRLLLGRMWSLRHVDS